MEAALSQPIGNSERSEKAVQKFRALRPHIPSSLQRTKDAAAQETAQMIDRKRRDLRELVGGTQPLTLHTTGKVEVARQIERDGNNPFKTHELVAKLLSRADEATAQDVRFPNHARVQIAQLARDGMLEMRVDRKRNIVWVPNPKKINDFLNQKMQTR